MNNYDTVIFEQTDEIVTVTLNRPKKNLLNHQMIEELIQIWHSLRTNTTARFVILTAQGKDFSGGLDLKEIGQSEISAKDVRQPLLAGHEMLRSLENLEQVTVAALQGVICGAGMLLAQGCDFRIMAEDSYYLLPEANVGFYIMWGGTPRLVRRVGASKAMEIIMTCDPIPAQEAYRLNLANKVVPNKTLLETTQEFIAKISSKDPGAIRITKKIALGASLEGFGNMFISESELVPEVVLREAFQMIK